MSVTPFRQEMQPAKPYPRDPGDPVVLIRPEVDPWLTIEAAPLDGATEASIHLSKQRQREERKAALAADEDAAVTHLRQSSLEDSLYADKVAKALHGTELSKPDRYLAGAIAVRTFDPMWAKVGRYRAAQGVLLVLRNVLSEHGMSLLISDQKLREAADRAAGMALSEQQRVVTNQRPVHLDEWQRAWLGLLQLGEDE